jgi:hypothetical protein
MSSYHVPDICNIAVYLGDAIATVFLKVIWQTISLYLEDIFHILCKTAGNSDLIEIKVLG